MAFVNRIDVGGQGGADRYAISVPANIHYLLLRTVAPSVPRIVQNTSRGRHQRASVWLQALAWVLLAETNPCSRPCMFSIYQAGASFGHYPLDQLAYASGPQWPGVADCRAWRTLKARYLERLVRLVCDDSRADASGPISESLALAYVLESLKDTSAVPCPRLWVGRVATNW
jgi:hypothetical protein